MFLFNKTVLFKPCNKLQPPDELLLERERQELKTTDFQLKPECLTCILAPVFN